MHKPVEWEAHRPGLRHRAPLYPAPAPGYTGQAVPLGHTGPQNKTLQKDMHCQLCRSLKKLTF